jgi:hypothetical protein
MVHRSLLIAASSFVTTFTLLAQNAELPAKVLARMRSVIAYQGAGVLGEDVRTLTEWGPEPHVPKAPRINDPRELFPPGKHQGVGFRPAPGDTPSESAPSKPGVPALELLRDVLPGAKNGHGFVRAVVLDAKELAKEPGYLQKLHCVGGDRNDLSDALPRFQEVREVKLGPLLDNRVAAALAGCRALTTLDARTAGLDDDGLLALAGIPTLRSLTLTGDLTALSGQTVPALHRLETLRLDDALPALDPRDAARGMLPAVLRLSNLHELQIHLAELPPDDAKGASALLAPLAAMPRLRRLAIVVDGDSLGSLARGIASLPLERLRLGGGELATADVEALVNNGHLRHLDLRDVTFTDVPGSAKVLAKATHLRRLGIAFTNLEPTATESLLAALPRTILQTGTFRQRPDGKAERVLVDRQAAAK